MKGVSFAAPAVLLLAAFGTRAMAEEVDPDLAKRVDLLVTRAMADLHLPGVTLTIVRKGRISLQKGYGLAHVETASPMTPETLLGIGSVTKVFTTIAILQLAEDGKLAIEDSLAKHLPDCPEKWKAITIRELLAMQSGIPETADFIPWQKVVAWATEQPLGFPPGTRAEYSNTNFHLLGKIIEAKSGKSYADYLQARILDPLGMSRTRMNSVPPPDGMATGYRWVEGGWHEAHYKPPETSFSSGGLVSNQIDLTKLDAGLAAQKLLSAESYRAMYEAQTLRDGKETARGLGWDSVCFEGRKRTLMKGGGIPGWRCLFIRALDEQVSVIVQANLEEKKVTDLAAAVLTEALR